MNFDRITIEPGKCGGKPCIRDLRLSVGRLVQLLYSYSDQYQLLSDYPDLEIEDLDQAIAYNSIHNCRSN